MKRICLGVLLFLAAGLAPLARAQPADTVKIGFASPLTGPQAHYGQDNLNGARMAIEDLAAEKFRIRGQVVRFQLLIEDDQADPRTGTVVAQRLVDAGVRGVVGHFNSGVSIPASKIYSDAGIPQLSVSTAVQYTRQGHRTAFRMMPDDDQQGAALGRYATGPLGLQRLAVVDDRTAYGQGLADAFAAAIEAAGGQVIRREYTTDKEVDFRAILTSIRSVKPDAIFFAGYDAQAGPLARQMRELGIAARLLGGETINTAKFIELAGPAAEGQIASTPGEALSRRPRGRVFAERYRRRFNQEVGLYAPYFYDAVMTIAAAMQQAASSEPARYLPALREIRHVGVTADIEFDANGDLKQGLHSFYRVVDGKWVLQE
ncbi:MAG TPA: branched-chain amino acid ABC transporter substrate-binding protein [Burkholderiales bacterium]|nr:branched-chain amino acid ABC transporter substrate-binding protein [Burkholderiales bacterium]